MKNEFYYYSGPGVRFILILLILTCNLARGEDWPQFLGPARNGVYSGAGFGWTKNGPVPGWKPALVWKKDVGQGFSAPALAGGRLVIFHRLGNRAVVDCLDANSGRPVWSAEYPTNYRDDFGFDEGPRGTPAIALGKVYTFGAEGVLQCLDFATGKRLWSVDTRQRFGADKGFFGQVCSPLVEGEQVLLNLGGRHGAGIAAFDAQTGKLRWSATDDEAGYSAPVAVTIAGLRHALFLTRAGLVDVEPATGHVRFQFPWRSRSQASVNAAAPVVAGNLVFLSASYGTGATVLEIDGTKAKQLWSSDDALSNHYATSVYRDGYLYGYHGRQEYGQSLRCIELKSGKVQWNADGLGAGTVTLAGDRLLLVRESGEIVIAEASPAAFRILARAALVPATVRAYPALADGKLYVRNEHTLACFSLK